MDVNNFGRWLKTSYLPYFIKFLFDKQVVNMYVIARSEATWQSPTHKGISYFLYLGESMQRVAEGLPYGPRTPQTA